MMESPDMKPDLSLLKREFNADLGDQPVNKSSRTAIVHASSSSLLGPGESDGVNYSNARIKTEPSKNLQLEQNESINNTDSYTAVQYESSIKVKGEQEGTAPETQKPAQNEDESPSEIPTSSPTSAPTTTAYRLKCHVSGCKVVCLGAEALQHHYNSRHVAKIKTSNNNNNNSDVIYSSSPPPSTTPNSNATTTCSSSSAKNKDAGVFITSRIPRKKKDTDKDSTSQFSCSVCNQQFKNSKSLYKHKFHKHGILQVPTNKNDSVSSTPNPKKNPNPKGSCVDQDIMKDTYKLSTPGVSSTDKEFKCPVPSCSSSSFSSLAQLEIHCSKDHQGQKFPWCGPDKLLKCPIYGCRRKTFHRQTGLEAHLKAKHGQSASEAASSAALICSGSSSGIHGDGVQSVEEEKVEEEKEVFECYFPNCSFTTLVQCQWESHERLHTGDTLRFKCNMENCGVAFFKSTTLLKHKQLLHGRTYN